ncbi:MAG: hypothetical protein A3H27_16560 [Acidobacteria bacterium RIFCSPLOWO2_02_FULL_59_13]|nr:MAG: hypothetical protein A3H27_16560 [Acidobacteria bacterium RIFCSPLOWO2_02_FULL_59_13]
MSVHRLGDVIDDYCTRCVLLTNHSIVSLVGEDVKKVRCRTCQHEHDYRHAKGGRKKTAKLTAYEQVLASVMAGKIPESPPKPPATNKPSRLPASGRRHARPGHTRPRSSR